MAFSPMCLELSKPNARAYTASQESRWQLPLLPHYFGKCVIATGLKLQTTCPHRSTRCHRIGVTVPGQTDRKLIRDVEQPGIAGVCGEQDQLANGDHASVVIGGLVLDVANLVGKAEALAVHHLSCRPALNGSAAHSLFSPS